MERQLNMLEEEFKDKEKNMKLKLLWAQMEKKDLATTILKLENSTHNIHQSDCKNRDNSQNYHRSFEDKHRGSHSEEKSGRHQEIEYKQDQKRHSEAFHKETQEDAHSGSRNRVSLRRKHIDGETHKIHERSKSAISLESHGVTRHVEFKLHNHA